MKKELITIDNVKKEISRKNKEYIHTIQVAMNEQMIREQVRVRSYLSKSYSGVYYIDRKSGEALTQQTVTQREYAKFLLSGLRIMEESDFSIFLFIIYINEAMTKSKYFEEAHPISRYICMCLEEAATTYIREKYSLKLDFSNFGSYSGIPARLKGLEVPLMMSPKNPMDYINYVYVLCAHIHLFWYSFFSDYGFVVCEQEWKSDDNLKNRTPFLIDDISSHFIIYKGMPYIADNLFDLRSTLVPAHEYIAAQKYSQEEVRNYYVGFLDKDSTNIRSENIVLFKGEDEYILYSEGNKPYSINPGNIYSVSSEWDDQAFIRLYYKYTLQKLGAIFHVSASRISSAIKRLELPKKVDLKNISYEHFLKTYMK